MLVPKFHLMFPDTFVEAPENSLVFYVDAVPPVETSALLQYPHAQHMMTEFLAYVKNGCYCGVMTSSFFDRWRFLWCRSSQAKIEELMNRGINYLGRVGPAPALLSCQLTNGIPLISLIELAMMLDAMVVVGDYHADEFLTGHPQVVQHRVCYAWNERYRTLIANNGKALSVSENIEADSSGRGFTFFFSPVDRISKTSVRVQFLPCLANSSQVDVRITLDAVLVKSLQNLFNMEKYLWIAE
jgi:hypothetical protein